MIASSDCYFLDSVEINLMTPCPKSAQRVAFYLNCAARHCYVQRKLRCLSVLCHDPDGELLDANDAFLDRVASASGSMWDIESLELNCFGRRAEPWRRLPDATGPASAA